ncbi:MBL fold metallo-hydrolase [Marinospirillum alkaliphilum]|uniref:Glyoxylase, beta-lactamase superfamily II n=1 Tax=Marinospirillum alkaliphilum DSM 21637 TaxID=1122209 RepID=A0A1K1YGG6_9GAMM|nr:Glyoxylase, beta-lactamase superfamily II [Marinospirillum alkaliphilum DSM 21637]
MLQFEILPVTPFAQNATLIWCDLTLEAAIIDAGGEVDRLLDAVAQRGLKLTKILLTHGHIDHAGGAADMKARTGLSIIGPHQDDQFWLDGLGQQSRMFAFPEAKPVIPDQWLNDGDQVQVGQSTLQVIHCPGHTPGHVVFYDPETRLAQVGDVLFAGSIGRTDFPKSNHQALIDSIRNKLFPLGDDVRFIPGHGPMSSFGEEKRSNPFVGSRFG